MIAPIHERENIVTLWRRRHRTAVDTGRVVGIWKRELDEVYGPHFTDNHRGRMIQTPHSTVMLLGRLAIVMDEGPEA